MHWVFHQVIEDVNPANHLMLMGLIFLFYLGLFPRYRDIVTGLVRTSVTATANMRGKTVNQIVTPSVVAVVRAHFNCPSLTGAELEDQGGSGTAGSHWYFS